MTYKELDELTKHLPDWWRNYVFQVKFAKEHGDTDFLNSCNPSVLNSIIDKL